MSGLADARRRAEEWLTRYDGAVPSIPPGSADPPEVRLLRALLAALPGETKPEPCRDCDGLGYTVEQVGVYPDGSAEPGQRKCDSCDGTGDKAAQPDAVREAAETISRIYFEIAAEAVGEEWVRAEFKRRLAALLAATSSAPPPRPAQDAVREAAERADKAMRDVFGGVDQFGDYCGHPVMPGKLAYAVQSLLAALPAEGEAKSCGPRCPFCESARISRDPALDCWSCETCRRSWGEATAPQPAPTPEPVSPAYTLPPEVEAAAEDVVRGDWWGHYCPSCGSTFKHGPECRIGRLAKALSSARAAKGGE